MVEKKKGFGPFVKFMAVVLAVLGSIVLIYAKYKNPDFNIWALVLAFVVMGVVVLIILFGTSIFTFWRSEEENTKFMLPPPVSDEVCFEKFEKTLRSKKYANMIKEIKDEGSESIGDPTTSVITDVYSVIVECVYPDSNNEKIKYVGVYNKHFPDIKKKILMNPSDQKISATKNLIATIPMKRPNIKKKVSKNELSGLEITETEETYDNPEKEKKKGDELE